MWTCSFRLTGFESRLEKHRKKTQRHQLHPAQMIAAAAPHLGVVITLAIMAGTAYVVAPSEQIRITSVTAPTGDGSITPVTQEQSVVVTGTVSNPRISQIFLDVNGSSRPVSVDKGAFQSRVALVPGRNRIQASLDHHGLGLAGTSQTARIVALIPPSDIWTELTWDGPGDIDLHLLQPDGEECSYQRRTTQAGATLDYDNTVQDGPEHITMMNAVAGTYQVKVVYYAAAGSPPRKVPWTVTLRLRNGAAQQTYSGVLESVGEAHTVTAFSLP